MLFKGQPYFCVRPAAPDGCIDFCICNPQRPTIEYHATQCTDGEATVLGYPAHRQILRLLPSWRRRSYTPHVNDTVIRFALLQHIRCSVTKYPGTRRLHEEDAVAFSTCTRQACKRS